MAAIASANVSRIGRRNPIGDEFEVTIRFTPSGLALANEWVAKADIGLSVITKIVGFCVIGAAAANAMNFAKNAQGTGVAEGTNPGDLGVEIATGAQLVECTVRGR